VITFDVSALLGYYQSRYGGTASTTASGLSVTAKKYAPTPPWDVSAKSPRESALVKQVLAGHKFIDENAAKLDLPAVYTNEFVKKANAKYPKG